MRREAPRLSDDLTALRPLLPENLVPTPCFREMAKIAQYFPPLDAGFECRLGSASPHADFAAALRVDQLLRLVSGKGLLEEALGGQEFQLLSEYVKSAPSERLPFYYLYLEWDLLQQAERVVRVFLPLRRLSEQLPDRLEERREAWTFAVESAAWLTGESFQAADALRQLLCGLPVQTEVFSIGFQLGNPARPLRLALFNADSSALFETLLASPLLERFSPAGVGRQFAWLKEICEPVIFTLDCACQPSERFGIMGMNHILRRPISSDRWKVVLEAFKQRGFCSEDQGRQVLGWQERVVPGRPDLLPTISHLKLDFFPGEEPLLKVYFGFLREADCEQDRARGSSPAERGNPLFVVPPSGGQ
jgi:hypothetical protein